MSEQQRAATIRRYYELVDAGDYEAMLALFTDDVVYERAGTAPIVGMDRMREFYFGGRIIKSGEHTVETLVADGEWVAARGVFEGELRTGEAVLTRWADFHQFDGDRISRRYTYFADRAV